MGGERPTVDAVRDYNKKQIVTILHVLDQEKIYQEIERDGDYFSFHTTANVVLLDKDGNQVHTNLELNVDFNPETKKLGLFLFLNKASGAFQILRFFIVFSKDESEANNYTNKTEPTLQVNQEYSGIGLGRVVLETINQRLLENVLRGYQIHLGNANFIYQVKDGTFDDNKGWTSRRMIEQGFNQIGEKTFQKRFQL